MAGPRRARVTCPPTSTLVLNNHPLQSDDILSPALFPKLKDSCSSCFRRLSDCELSNLATQVSLLNMAHYGHTWSRQTGLHSAHPLIECRGRSCNSAFLNLDAVRGWSNHGNQSWTLTVRTLTVRTLTRFGFGCSTASPNARLFASKGPHHRTWQSAFVHGLILQAPILQLIDTLEFH